MPTTVTRVNPQGGHPNYEDDVMRVTKSNGNLIDVDLYDYVKFQRSNGTVINGRVTAFSSMNQPDSFRIAIGLNSNIDSSSLTDSELDSLENLGKQNPSQIGGKRKNRHGTKKAHHKRRRGTKKAHHKRHRGTKKAYHKRRRSTRRN